MTHSNSALDAAQDFSIPDASALRSWRGGVSGPSPCLWLLFGRMCITKQREERQRKREQEREKPEEMLGAASAGPQLLTSDTRTLVQPVGRRTVSGAKYTLIGIFRGLL